MMKLVQRCITNIFSGTKEERVIGTLFPENLPIAKKSNLKSKSATKKKTLKKISTLKDINFTTTTSDEDAKPVDPARHTNYSKVQNLPIQTDSMTNFLQTIAIYYLFREEEFSKYMELVVKGEP